MTLNDRIALQLGRAIIQVEVLTDQLETASQTIQELLEAKEVSDEQLHSPSDAAPDDDYDT